MKVEEISKTYNQKLELRDNLKIVEEELKKLEEKETVKNYIKLKSFYDDNKEFANKKDDEILNMIIDYEHLELELHDCYFCLGKNYKAKINENGEYYIISDNNKSKRFNSQINVGVYKSFEDPEKIIIIPIKEVEKFEEEHPILYSKKSDIEEYIRLRRLVVKDELDYYNKNKVVRNSK